ncbi:unnamed protein product [Rotaria sp. Silwood1]|nr:unnamed protein product [Rotaria sp. Silwood1]CAF1589042.1 unnamed protein product [Rotaria sp. Silwood1]CAF1596918.1 unnamed protein product [Rotaria sp. Silwood1]
MDKTIHEQWTCKFAKVKAVVVQLDELISRIKIDHKIQKTTEEPLSINIFTTRADAGEPKVEAPKSANYQSCVFGQDTQISWKFSGIEKSQVSWFFKGQPLPTNSRFQVTETDDGTSTLSIHQAELVDQGDYIARATNADGEAEARTILNIVCIKPIINTNLDAAMQVTKDETMTLKIAASGTPKPGIVWMRGNDQLTPNDRIQMTTPTHNADIYTLTILNVQPEDQGEYSAMISNVGGSLQSIKCKVTVSSTSS